MYLFIATIFIAELIIASALVSFIVRADKKVCEINNSVTVSKPILEENLKVFKKSVISLQNTVESFFTFIRKKREQFTMKIIVTLVMYASLIFFRGRFKKAAAVFQTLVLVKDYWDELTI